MTPINALTDTQLNENLEETSTFSVACQFPNDISTYRNSNISTLQYIKLI